MTIGPLSTLPWKEGRSPQPEPQATAEATGVG
jgi:hypothetical protein